MYSRQSWLSPCSSLKMDRENLSYTFIHALFSCLSTLCYLKGPLQVSDKGQSIFKKSYVGISPRYLSTSCVTWGWQQTQHSQDHPDLQNHNLPLISFLFLFFEAESLVFWCQICCVTEDDLEFLIILPPLPKPLFCGTGDPRQSSFMVGKHSIHWAKSPAFTVCISIRSSWTVLILSL